MRHHRATTSAFTLFLAPTAVTILLGLGCSSADLGSTTGGLSGSSTGGSSNTGSSGSTTGGANNGSSGGTSSSSGGGSNAATGGSSAQGAPTWTQLYNNYFGSGTPGNCTSCHNAGTSPAFNSASQLCTVLKGISVIGNGTASMDTLLTWFNSGGSMPPGGANNLSSAVTDINAWKNAGAVCP